MFVHQREVVLWVALLSGACAAQPGPEGQVSARPSARPEPLESSFLPACQARCERGRAMQAVAIEVIRAGCAEECRVSWALPMLTAGAQLDRSPAQGQRVRLWGQVEASGEGWALLLEDGRRIALVAADPGPLPLGAALVLGTLEAAGVVGAWILPQKAEEKGGM